MNKIIKSVSDITLGILGAVAISGALAGCGASGEDISDEVEIIDGGELGQAEQAVQAKKTPGFGFGLQTGAAGLRCSLTSTGQTCSAPSKKTFVYHVTSGGGSGFSSAEALLIRSDVQSVALSAGHTWTHTTSIGSADVVIQRGAVSGNLSNNIDGYVSVTFGGVTSLTDSLPGNYQSHSTAVATLDYADADNKGANATEDARLKTHMTRNAIVKIMGIGSQTTILAPAPVDGCGALNCRFASSRAVTPFQPNVVNFSRGEKCAIDAYAPSTSPGSFVYEAAVCAFD